MFVILTFSQTDSDCFLRRILDKLKPRPPTVSHGKAMGCKYVHINQPLGSGAAPKWKRIEKIAGRWAGRLYMNKDIAIDPRSCISRASTTEYEERICVNTACQALDKSRTELYERQVGLVDREGKFQWAAPQLLKYCTTLYVYTESPKRYEKFCSQMLEAYGAPVFVSDNIKSLEKCILIVSPDCRDYDWPQCPVITCSRFMAKNVVNQISFSPLQIGFPIPRNIDPIIFAAALWQTSKVGSLAKLWGDNCRVGGRLSDIGDCSALIYSRAVCLRNSSNT